MGNVVAFQSPGLIDPRCITTIGVSVKEGENPIGYFGTGLKYAIAIILRNRGQITIWRGLEKHELGVKVSEIRGKAMAIVTMDGKELGFTHDLGKNWVAWQAFREIYCNTLDEQGEMQLAATRPKPDTTTVHVEWEAFWECAKNRAKYVMEPDAIYANRGVDFQSSSGISTYYRRVLVAEGTKPWKYQPNITSEISLTEDRTLRSSYQVDEAIGDSILNMVPGYEDFTRDWLTVGPNFQEHEVDLTWQSHLATPAFVALAREILSNPSTKCNRSLKMLMERHQVKVEPQAVELMAHEKKALARAVEFSKALGYTVDEYSFTVVESLGQNVLGQADRKQQKYYITQATINQGDLFLAATLIEEWCHIKHGHNDETRGMQNWLFEQITRLGAAYLDLKGGGA